MGSFPLVLSWRSDHRGDGLEEGQVADQIRPQRDPFTEIVAYPVGGHGDRRFGVLVSLPHAERQTGLLTEVGEAARA